jgi:hypothetical protein
MVINSNKILDLVGLRGKKYIIVLFCGHVYFLVPRFDEAFDPSPVFISLLAAPTRKFETEN